MTVWIVFIPALCALLIASTSAATDEYYTAAVFEHASYRHENDSAEDEMVSKNLFLYKKAAIAAKRKGADILVFSEYGLFHTARREKMRKYLEYIPDPKKTKTNPCDEKDAYFNRPILLSLSCMAKNNNIFIVANMGDLQNCEGDPECPSDGAFHFNANVVFNRDGTLVLKYHKEYLHFELAMDLAREKQDSRFKTDFGTFATYINFDLLFKRMTQSVDAVLFPSLWFFLGPQFSSVQTFQGWSIGTNSTLIAASTHGLAYYSIGSGIFHGQEGALGYTYNPDGISKLVVAKVPRPGYSRVPESSSILAITEDKEWDVNDDGKDVHQSCAQHLRELNKTTHCFEENTANYTFAKLTKRSDHIEACNNGMCCSLDYTAAELLENYYLGVFNGTYNSFDKYFWCEEVCVLVRCEAVGENPCGTFLMKAKTIFHHVQLRANFSKKEVYPSMVSSGMRLVPRNEWKFEPPNGPRNQSLINMKNQKGKQLISLGFKSRCYERDPPYIR